MPITCRSHGNFLLDRFSLLGAACSLLLDVGRVSHVLHMPGHEVQWCISTNFFDVEVFSVPIGPSHCCLLECAVWLLFHLKKLVTLKLGIFFQIILPERLELYCRV